MKNIICLFLSLIIICSCDSTNNSNIYKTIREFEFSRNSDTLLYSQLITSQDDQVKISIAKSIGRMGNEFFLPLLDRLIQEKNYEIIKQTIFSFGQIGSSECEKKLLTFIEMPQFSKNKSDIILSLGQCAGKTGSDYLLKHLSSFNDSLKIQAIQNLSYIYKRHKKLNAIPDSILNYLNHKSTNIRGAAIYFFYRNEYKLAYYDLLTANVFTNTNTYKYKLSALSKILEKFKVDSLMLDSLKTILVNKKFFEEPDWKKLIYKIKILSNYPDSLTISQIASFLKNQNPHVRQSAINSLGKISSDYSKNILLQYYDSANWIEKGNIILNIANKYPDLAYTLVQQNLDQGNSHFKELLLQSLGCINNNESRTLLKQFLIVPEPRLQVTAFQELDKLKRLSYKDVLILLQNDNELLASFAAYWIGEHPKSAKLEDLISAYNKFDETKNAETMVTIIETINKLKQKNSTTFLDSTYLQTSQPNIAKAVADGLAAFNIKVKERDFKNSGLFIPDSLITDGLLNATIKTNKGNIEIELWPLETPLTVSNFYTLIQRGYFKNILFHRVVADFVVQAGDPSGTGWGGSGYSIPCEYNDKPYIRGSVGMATAGKDTGGSQFFICHSEQPHLNRRYTNFGIVKSGMDVVDKITKDDKILEITIN